MKKRIAAMMLSLAMLSAMTIFGMTACGAKKADPASSAPAPGASKSSEASAPSTPAPEASAPASQASGEQPQGGNGAGSLEALLEKYTVKDFPKDYMYEGLFLNGGIKDGQEYWWYDEEGSAGATIMTEYTNDPDAFTMVVFDPLDPEGVRFVLRGRGKEYECTVQPHPKNAKWLEVLLPDASGNMISYTAIATELPIGTKEEPGKMVETIVLFRTDGSDGATVQYFSPPLMPVFQGF